MITTTQTLLICVIFICGLEETVLSQLGHCAGNLCFALFQEPRDFLGAQKSCKDQDGQLFVISSEQAEKTLTTPRNGSYWLKLHSTGRTEGAAVGLQNCSSITVSTEGITVLWRPCRDKLDGFLCEGAPVVPCSRLQAGDGAQVRYTPDVASETLPSGNIAVAEKVGSKYPYSKHVCFAGHWLPAPWKCEVLNGGCEHSCDFTTNTCICPTRQTLHPNNFTCNENPCAGCAQSCQQEGDTYVCTCKSGYRLAQDGKSCVDVDECMEQDPCTGEGEQCFNTEGGHECRCKDDFYVEDGVCVDFSICMKCEHKCEKHNGVYQCECYKGYKVSAKDPTKCKQTCTKRDCLAKCIQKEDVEKQCYCPDGYITDTRNNTTFCTDINECENEKPCDHKCENLFGGYRCLCNKGFELHNDHKCLPIKAEEGLGSTPLYPTSASAYPATVPSYIKSGSVLGITVFIFLCAVLLFFMVRHIAKRCGKFELSSLRRPDIDIFYLQQVTTETYKRLSLDKQFKNDLQRQ